MSDLSKLLMQEMEHAVFILVPDAQGEPRYADMSEHVRKRLQKSRDEIIGKTAKEIYPGRLGEMAYQNHLKAVQTGKRIEYEIMLPMDGAPIPIKTSLRPVCDEDGNVVCVICSSSDISGGKAIREMKAELETFNSEVEDFISLAAHDLRSPMRQVSQVAQLLRRDFVDHGDGKIELINLLERVAEKATRLVSDVLAHAQATTVDEERLEFDFGELVDDIAAVLDPQKKIEISHSGGFVVGDRIATHLVLRNLMDNSIKFAWAADGRLHLNVELEDLGNGFIQVEVRDNGAGFDEAALEFLNGGRMGVDSGFGLLGVRRLIRARDGVLVAGNRADEQGAIVTFTLPGKVVTRRDRKTRVA